MKKIILSTIAGVMLSTSALALTPDQSDQLDNYVSNQLSTYAGDADSLPTGFLFDFILNAASNQLGFTVTPNALIAAVDNSDGSSGQVVINTEVEELTTVNDWYTLEELAMSEEYGPNLDTPGFLPGSPLSIREQFTRQGGELIGRNGRPLTPRTTPVPLFTTNLRSADGEITAYERAERERERAERDAEVKALSSRVDAAVSADNSRVIGDKDATSLDQAIADTLGDDTTADDIQAAARDGSGLASIAVADRLANGETLSDSDKAQEYADRNPRFAAFQAAVANLNRQ